MASVVGCLMASVVAGKRLFMVSVAGLLVDSAAAGGSNILECIERFLVFEFLGLVSVAGFLNGFRRGRKTFLLRFPSLVVYGFRRAKERFCMVSVVVLFLWFPAATGPRLSLRWNLLNKTSGRFHDELSIYIYIYIYTYVICYIY